MLMPPPADTPMAGRETHRLSRRDFVAGTAIAVALVGGSVALSPGRALVVTFVPGVAFAWILLLRFRWGGAIPRGPEAFRLFLLVLGVQLLHFAEELGTGFPARFPPLYGGDAMDVGVFVAGNLAAYGAFAFAAWHVFLRGRGLLLLPVLFFAGYGTLGNATAHVTWTVHTGGYFPGVVTSLVHGVAGPLLLRRVLGKRRTVWLYGAPFIAVLAVVLILGMD